MAYLCTIKIVVFITERIRRCHDISITNPQQGNGWGLDKRFSRSKIPGNYGENVHPSADVLFTQSRNMTPKLPAPPQNVSIKQPCKHPRVQIVSRDEDAEFVECKECGEIFESSEFKDMNIEDRTQENEA